MAAWEALKGLTAQLASATTAEQIGGALFDISQRFGLTSLLILDATKMLSRVGPAIVYASAPREFVEQFDAVRPIVQGQAYQQAQVSDRPFLLSDVPNQDNARISWWYPSPGGPRHRSGLVVPVHIGGEFVWGAGFTGEEPDLSQAAQSVLSAAVHAGYTRFCELLDAGAPNSPLSPREAECLRWVADGKTDYEIGKILNISPRTVRFHIRNAKEKLGVATRIQAVAKRVAGGG